MTMQKAAECRKELPDARASALSPQQAEGPNRCGRRAEWRFRPQDRTGAFEEPGYGQGRHPNRAPGKNQATASCPCLAATVAATIQIPAGLTGGDQALVLSVSSVASQANVKIAIQA